MYAPDAATLIAADLLAGPPTYDNVNTNGVDPTKPGGFNVTCTIGVPNGDNCQNDGVVDSGGTMVLAAGSLSGPYNSATSSNGSTHPLDEAMFDGLLAFDPPGNVVPDLAASMPR